MTLSRLEQAARNNAIWCDTVCRVHGIAGEFHETLWLNRHPVPRFYSNAITLAQPRQPTEPVAYLETLINSSLPRNWSVKDSFGELDLTALNFQPLFEATWLWRSADRTLPAHTRAGIRWTWMHNESELTQWETAWNNHPANASPTPQPRLFLPALLADPNVAFIAAYQAEIIVGVAIANRTAEVVGLSNVFGPSVENEWFWSGCIATAQQRFPRLPLVGYQRGAELAVAQAVGFERMQDFRVWLHTS